MDLTFKNRKYYIALSLILAVSFFLHFRNLFGASYVNSDEARAFSFLSTGPLITLLNRPFFLLTKRIDIAFYVSSFFGFSNIIIFYLILKKLFDRTTVFLALCSYAFFPFRINFARTLLPAVYTEFFFLLFLFFTIKSLLKRNAKLMILVGVFSALQLFAHFFTYSLLFGTWVSIFCLPYINKEKINYTLYLLNYFIGFILSCIILEAILFFVADGYTYIQKILLISGTPHVKGYLETDAFRQEYWFGLFDTLLYTVTHSLYNILRFIFVVGACLASIIDIVKNRKPWYLFFLIHLIAAVSIFLLLGYLTFHATVERHFVWISIPISLFIANTISGFLNKRNMVIRNIIIFTFLAFTVSSIIRSYQVSEEMFKPTIITSWLDKNNIAKREVMTNFNFHTVKDAKENNFSMRIPGGYLSKSYADIDYKIHWPLVYKAYLQKRIKYFIDSGIGRNVYIGENDIMLKNVKPIHSLEHPISKFQYRFFRKDGWRNGMHQMIHIYRMQDIFSKENLLYVAKINPVFFESFKAALTK